MPSSYNSQNASFDFGFDLNETSRVELRALHLSQRNIEFPGVLTHVYKYYGKQPFYIGNFPLHWAWLNGTGFLMVGFLLWLVVPRLQGAQKALILLVPTFAFLGSYGMTAMPAFASINWEMSRLAQHIVDLASLGLCLIVVRGIAEAVHTPDTVVASEGRPLAAETDGELVRAR
jgi:hypothetical protein